MNASRVTNRGLLARDPGKWPVLSAILLALSCSSTTEPGPPVTLLVWNATCSAGDCASIQIRAFPKNQPQTPAGLWSLDLGTASSAITCLAVYPD